jgi:hypothetical protein
MEVIQRGVTGLYTLNYSPYLEREVGGYDETGRHPCLDYLTIAQFSQWNCVPNRYGTRTRQT